MKVIHGTGLFLGLVMAVYGMTDVWPNKGYEGEYNNIKASVKQQRAVREKAKGGGAMEEEEDERRRRR